jgi:hypothetical protein
MQITVTRENMGCWKDDGQKLKNALDGAHVIFGTDLWDQCSGYNALYKDIVQIR